MSPVWLDRVCIDQKNITEDLGCLPVFVVACKELLILHGETYMGRLWCEFFSRFSRFPCF